MGGRLASHPSFCSEAKSRAALRYERRARPVLSRAGACFPGEGTRRPWAYWPRRAQGWRICHRRRPARSLAERVVCPPPKVLGLDTPKDAPARPFVIYLVVCVAFPNTLLYPYGRAATGEGRAPVRRCELVCEFVIHRGFIGVGDDGAMKDKEHFLEEQEAHKGRENTLDP